MGGRSDRARPRSRVLPLRRLSAPAWAEQRGTWRQARPEIINAALDRCRARPSGNWYVLAASTRITGNEPFARTVGGTEIVAWRTPDGRAHAGPGICPHLGAPLGTAVVDRGQLVCAWHGLRLTERGGPGWSPLPTHDDGVLTWVRLDGIGGERPLSSPVVPRRPVLRESLVEVATTSGVCEPEDIVANRLDPWHGAWFHPHSFAELGVRHAPEVGCSEEEDFFEVSVTFRVASRLGAPVTAVFTCPEPRTVVMRILDGEGAGSVVETHAVPLGRDAHGRPRTAVVEAVLAHSERPGFRRAVLPAARLLRPLVRRAALRLWSDDMAYAERRYQLRSAGLFPG
ncbi:DUF5914 domain-containing protein [Actinopolyspora mortivallis]|uniref:2Fe-2S ferredoxin n=1 Tax=Actinopolyspora mortivallis TaxID=33906 RepID=A0A2T0GUG5_ACTMO|nr:DUF5914 domain-containing protein [Actinopolyspora mortivallis]PRW62737.1 2Fe-2S ferredoxin [Actinopolyspora mortivallis]